MVQDKYQLRFHGTPLKEVFAGELAHKKNIKKQATTIQRRPNQSTSQGASLSFFPFAQVVVNAKIVDSPNPYTHIPSLSTVSTSERIFLKLP